MKKKEKDEKKLDVEKLIQDHNEKQKQQSADYQEMAFKDYLKLLEKEPLIAQNSPSRILEIILGKNGERVEIIPESEGFSGTDKRYSLFAKSLFGLDKSIQNVVEHIKAGANNLSTGKQILLLVGPPASGKSTFASILKRGVDRYGDRPVFRIKDCPISEEPLHLLPRGEDVRKDISKKLGVKIEGDLCPVCRDKLIKKYNKEWYNVPVETFTFSIQGGRGIGTFEPSDEKTSDVTELVGRENIGITSRYGYNHPQAHELNGELEKANRGIFEGRELIKSDEKLLWVFISVAEEKEIRVQGSNFPPLAIDTLVIGHTNLTEYKKFASRLENEALHDRIYVVFFPYPLRIQDEVKIYRKLTEGESDFTKLKKCHLAPGTLELAALFAVLTRLNDSNYLSSLVKAKIYNGDKILTEIGDKEKRPIDLRQLMDEGQNNSDISKREGMFGMSSRDILAALNNALVKQSDGENGCLTPLKAFKALREVFDHRMHYNPEQIKRYKDLISDADGAVLGEYRDWIVNAVSKAFLKAYDDLAKELFNRYLREARLSHNQHATYVKEQSENLERDEYTGKPKEADVKFLRSVEEHIPISEQAAERFRGEILAIKNPTYETYAPLARAIERKLLADCRSSLTLVLASDKPKGDEEKRRVEDIFSGLTDRGYCSVCAKEAVEKARDFLSS